MADENEDEDNKSLSDLQINKDLKWSKQHEKILIDWADKAMCYRWLHSKANRKYYKLNAVFTIPVIIISTLTGTANFAQDKFEEGTQREYAVMTIGSLNILAGIITTIHQYLKISELNESHRVSCVAWDKFFRNLKVELAKPRDERVPVFQLLKWAKEEFDRLTETSPIVPQNIIKEFLSSFKKKEDFHLISKPDVCDELVSIEKFMHKVPERDIESNPHVSINIEHELKLKNTEHIEIPKKVTNYDLIQQFNNDFYKLYERYPIETELINKFSDIEPDEIEKISIQLNTMSGHSP